MLQHFGIALSLSRRDRSPFQKSMFEVRNPSGMQTVSRRPQEIASLLHHPIDASFQRYCLQIIVLK
jgi:hypothetical protein